VLAFNSLQAIPEWRNWQTQQTQNLPGITPRVGSTPSSGTLIFRILEKSAKSAIYKPFLTISLPVKYDHQCQAMPLFWVDWQQLATVKLGPDPLKKGRVRAHVRYQHKAIDCCEAFQGKTPQL
jgi:hypothetical protein